MAVEANITLPVTDTIYSAKMQLLFCLSKETRSCQKKGEYNVAQYEIALPEIVDLLKN